MVPSLKEKILLKFPGVILDEHLIWKKHIQLTENKISENVGALYKTSKLINSKCFPRIYFSFYSYINYVKITWASTNKPKLKKLFRKQKQAARIILNQDRFTHACQILNALNGY